MSQTSSLVNLTRWARNRAVGYTLNKGLIFGVEAEIIPHASVAPGVFPLYSDIGKHPQIDVCGDLSSLEIFSPASFDYVILGARWNTLADPNTTLNTLLSKLKRNGHLIVFLPVVSESDPVDFRTYLSSYGSFLAKDSYTSPQTHNEHHYFLQIYKKLKGGHGMGDMVRPTPGTPRACVVRYGAMGDMIMLTPLLKQLKSDGYHVTVNCTRYSADILENNPNVDNIILQERDAIYNPDLGEYWKIWEKDYDKYINLSESIEGKLLKVEGRRDYYTSKEWRNKECNKNYYDYTMLLGGYPESVGRSGELYFSPAELRYAQDFRRKYKSKRIILWALNGSSYHKLYGLFEPVVRDFLDGHPECIIVTVGDSRTKEYEFEHDRLVCLTGHTTIRQSLSLLTIADCVVGPESMMTNGAGCFDVPKIVFMSHSSPEALTKYWKNCYALEPDTTLAPCYPCNQLHYTFDSCPIVDITAPNDQGIEEAFTRGPACAMGAISGELVIRTLEKALNLPESTIS